MSAGDVRFIGTPQVVEHEPRVSYEPQINRFVPVPSVLKKVVRTYSVPTALKPAFLQQTKRLNVSISAPYIKPDGSTGLLNLGGGYNLESVDDAPSGMPGYTQVTLNYAKTVQSAFEFDLPENVTVACLNGVCSINYAGSALELHDSGTGVCGEGLNVLTPAYRLIFMPLITVGAAIEGEPHTARRLSVGSEYVRVPELDLTCNGVTMETYKITESAFPQLANRIQSFTRLTGAINTPYTEQDYNDALAAHADEYDEIAHVHQIFRKRSTGDPSGYVTSSKLYYIAGLTKGEIPNILPYRNESWQLNWNMDGDTLQLRVGPFVWKQWELDS